MREKRKNRVQQTLEYICWYAFENSGVTPSSEDIAAHFEFSQQRAYYLLNRLSALGKIRFVNRFKYLVVNSTWDPPPDVV